MSECERFAQVVQDKWATVSKSLRLLMTNEQMWAIHSGRSGQMSKSLVFFWANCSFSYSLTKNGRFAPVFWSYKKNKGALIPSERSERISQVAQDKRATVSDSLRSEGMCGGEQIAQVAHRKWANCSLFEQIAHSLTFLAKKERFPPKFDERIPNPAVKKAYVRQRVDMETNAFKVWQITVFKNSVLL